MDNLEIIKNYILTGATAGIIGGMLVWFTGWSCSAIIGHFKALSR